MSRGTILKKRFLLAWSTVRLRFKSAVVSLRMGRFFRKQGVRRRAYMRGVTLWVTLSLCVFVSVGAIALSILAEREPKLLSLGGTLPRVDEVMIVDPNRRDEFQLSPGVLYDRPVAAIQTGTEALLLRARIESTLLAVDRDEKGLVVVALPTNEPGEDYIPRTVSQESALQILVNNGFCKKNASWDEVFNTRLGSRRFPNGENEGGRLVVFEKKTVTVNQDSDIAIPDLEALLPEDIEELNLSKTTYSYIGFYTMTDYTDTGEITLYQPLRLSLQNAPKQDQPPTITTIHYEYFQWDLQQRAVHLFGVEAAGPVAVQPGEALRPIAEWTEPTDAWFYDSEGWIYYGQVLQPGVMTPLLLKNFSVSPQSALIQDENRYRLRVRIQTAPLDHNQVAKVWDNGQNMEGLGVNRVNPDAAPLVSGLLGLTAGED